MGTGSWVFVPGEGLSFPRDNPPSDVLTLGTGFGGDPWARAGFCPVSLLPTSEAASRRYIDEVMSYADIRLSGEAMSHRGFLWALDGRDQELIFSFKIGLFFFLVSSSQLLKTVKCIPEYT